MKHLFYLSFYVVIGIIISGCAQDYNKEAVKEADEMINKAEMLIEKLSQDHVINYQPLYDTIRAYNEFFLNLPDNFDMSKENIDIIANYGAVEKIFKKLHSHFLSGFKNDVIRSKSQLKALRDDIKNNRIDSDEEIQQYLNHEKEILMELEFFIIDKLEYADEAYERYQKYQPKVEKLVDEYDFSI